uniref:G protein-coupled receptor n=1 Tax=Steinernema glaseri TaxID=37863 RepID=A0A1I7YTH6_9BILA
MASVFLRAVTVNSVLAGSSSLLLNALLIYMIWFRSTADLKNYRTFFLIYNAIDVCFTFISLSTHLLMFIHNSDIVFVAAGFITYLGQWPSQMCLIAQIFFYPFVIAIIPCTYVYRNVKLPPRFIIMLFFVAFFVVLPYIISVFFCRQSTSENAVLYEKMVSLMLEVDDPQGYYYIGGRLINADFLTAVLAAVIVFIGSYAVIFFCGFRIVKVLEAHRASASIVSQQLQQQLTLVLKIEAVVPLLFFVAPMLLVIMDVGFGINFGRLSTGLLAVVEWLPACDAAITLYCVKPYRRGIKNILLRMTTAAYAVEPS